MAIKFNYTLEELDRQVLEQITPPSLTPTIRPPRIGRVGFGRGVGQIPKPPLFIPKPIRPPKLPESVNDLPFLGGL